MKNCATGHCRKPEQDRRQCPYHVNEPDARKENREIKRRKKVTTCPVYKTPRWITDVYSAVRYELPPEDMDFAILEGVSVVMATRAEVLEEQARKSGQSTSAEVY